MQKEILHSDYNSFSPLLVLCFSFFFFLNLNTVQFILLRFQKVFFFLMKLHLYPSNVCQKGNAVVSTEEKENQIKGKKAWNSFLCSTVRGRLAGNTTPSLISKFVNDGPRLNMKFTNHSVNLYVCIPVYTRLFIYLYVYISIYLSNIFLRVALAQNVCVREMVLTVYQIMILKYLYICSFFKYLTVFQHA